MNFDVNLFAVLVGAILTMAIGAVWYSPVLFAKPWMAAVGKTMEEMRQSGASYAYVVSTFGAIVMSYVLAVVIKSASVEGIVAGALAGLLVWFGMVFTSNLTNTVFSGRPLQLAFIDSGYFLLALLIDGALFGMWK